MTTPSDSANKDDFAEAIVAWEDYARSLPDTHAGRNMAALSLRAAESLRIERDTGIAVCTCCYKPIGPGIRH